MKVVYRRFQSSESKIGIFSDRRLQEDFKEVLTDRELRLWKILYCDLEPTEFMEELKNIKVSHYFTQEFWEEHKTILERIKNLVGIVENLEYLEVEPYEIKKIWFKDSQQVILQP